jgi:hypothetical protein
LVFIKPRLQTTAAQEMLFSTGAVVKALLPLCVKSMRLAAPVFLPAPADGAWQK